MELQTLEAFAQAGGIGVALVLIYFGYLERKESRKSMEIISERDNAFQKSAFEAIKGNNEGIRKIAERTGDVEKVLDRQTLILENHTKHMEQALAQSAQTQESFRVTLEAFLLFIRKNGNGNGK